MAALTRIESWSKEEVDVLVAQTRADAKNPKIHTQFDLYVSSVQPPMSQDKLYGSPFLTSRISYVVYGQKPE